jgi:polyvinyl alcohol dehydrogenase (cytochrome)
MAPATILQALESGPMKLQAAGLTNGERYALLTYLSSPPPKAAASVSATGLCSSVKQVAKRSPEAPSWNGWGAGPANRRFQETSAAGMGAAQVANLKLKWAFGLGDGTSVRSQPAAGIGSVFVASLSGEVNSLEARTGCVQWTFKAEGTVRSGISFAITSDAARQPRVYFADDHANMYALTAATGALLWKVHVGDHFATLITGTPLIERDVVYVPTSSYEEVLAASPTYECCTFRGSVVALNAATGKSLWTTYTIDQSSQPTTKSKTGAQMRGPSGAAIWSAPTFDEKRNVLYVATGDNYSDPATANSDAVLALDAKSGKLLWSKQLTPNDVYNMGTNATGHDFDFGQPPILVDLRNGRRALVIGQKSGVVHALDPDRQGEVLWQTRVGNGGPLGGIQWGSAADAENVYVGLSDLAMKGVPDKTSPQGYRLELDPNQGGGLFALQLTDGKKVWNTKPVGCGERKQCSPAQSAPVTAIPGAVFSGSIDGHLRAYSTETGQVIVDIDTAKDYDTVNGRQARGGSLDCAGPVIAGGMLYVTSGYGQWGGMPGNVLLAFSVDGK